MIRTINKSLLCLTVILLVSGYVVGQPVAKIVGPSQAPAGELVVLSSNGSAGDNVVWVTPESIQTVRAGCTILDTQVFFSTTKPGKYEFMLIAADKTAAIAFTKHVVTVTGSIVDPPPVDPPPVDPDDPPPVPNPAKWSGLQSISKFGADKINDTATRPKLKAAIAASVLDIEAKCAAGNCPTLDAAKEQVRKAIEGTLLTRTGVSARTDWTPWRKSNQAELDKLGVTDTKDYLGAAKAIGSGL